MDRLDLTANWGTHRKGMSPNDADLQRLSLGQIGPHLTSGAFGTRYAVTVSIGEARTDCKWPVEQAGQSVTSRPNRCGSRTASGGIGSGSIFNHQEFLKKAWTFPHFQHLDLLTTEKWIGSLYGHADNRKRPWRFAFGLKITAEHGRMLPLQPVFNWELPPGECRRFF
ncbi:MAG: hypothetical protein M1499_01420 [Firmicutes bacterium]|nr:hypothetical protein [Bacillota bacterium]